MLCSSWTNPQMTASPHWEFRVLHNFNPSARKNRLCPALMVGELTCKTEDWTKQRRPRSQTFPQFQPPPPLYLEPHHICSNPKNGFLRSLTPDFLPRLTLGFPDNSSYGNNSLRFARPKLYFAHSNRDLPFITRRPAENGACRFSKNVIQFQFLWNKLGFVGAIFGYFLGLESWQANHGSFKLRLINTVNTFWQV